MGRKRGNGRAYRGQVAVPASGGSKPSQPQPESKALWQRVLGSSAKWTLGLFSAAVVAAVTAAVTVLVTQHVSAAPKTVRHGPPVKIDSVAVLRNIDQAGTYVFLGALQLSRADLASLNRLRLGTSAYDAWFRDRGGVDPDSSNVQVVVEGNANGPARITNITMMKSCGPRLAGTLFDNPPAGSAGVIPIHFNLDSPLSIAETPDGKDYFLRNTISLRPSEVQVIQITASTNLHYCQYALQLTVLVGAHSVTETVSNHGKPFQVTGLYGPARYHALYAGGVESPVGGPFAQEDPRTGRVIR